MEVDRAVKKKKKRDRDIEDLEEGQEAGPPKAKKRKKDKHKAEEEEQVVPSLGEEEVVGDEKRVKKKKKHRHVEEERENVDADLSLVVPSVSEAEVLGEEIRVKKKKKHKKVEEELDEVDAHLSLVVPSLSVTEVVGDEKRVKKKKKHRQVEEERENVDAHLSLVVPSVSEADVFVEEKRVKKKKKHKNVGEELDEVDAHQNLVEPSLSEAEAVGDDIKVKKKKLRKMKEELKEVDAHQGLVVPSLKEAEVGGEAEKVKKKKKKKKHRIVEEELDDAYSQQSLVVSNLSEAEAVGEAVKVKKEKKKKRRQVDEDLEDADAREFGVSLVVPILREVDDAEAHQDQGLVMEDQASNSYEDLEISHKKRKKKHKKFEDDKPTVDEVVPEVKYKKKKCKDSESPTEVEVASATVENLWGNDENVDPELSGLVKKKKKKKSRDVEVSESPAPGTEDEEPPRKKKKKKKDTCQEDGPLLDEPADTSGNNNDAPKERKKMKRLYSSSGLPVLFEQSQEQFEGPLTVFSPHKEFEVKRDLVDDEDEDVDPLTLPLPESIGLDDSYSQEDTEQEIAQEECETGGVKAGEYVSDEDDDEPLVKPKLKKVKKVMAVSEEEEPRPDSTEEESPKKKKKKQKKADEEQNSIENLLSAAVKKVRSEPVAKLKTRQATAVSRLAEAREGRKEYEEARERRQKEDSKPWREVPRVKKSVGIMRLYVLPDRKVVGPALHGLCQHILKSNILVSPLNQEYMEVSFKKLELHSPGQGLRGQLEERYRMRMGKWELDEDASIMDRYHELQDSGMVTDDEEMVALLNSQKGKLSKTRDHTSRNIVGLYVGQDLPHRVAYELSQRLLEKLSGRSIRTPHKVRKAKRAVAGAASQSEPEPRALPKRWSLDDDFTLMDLVLKQPLGVYRPVAELTEKRDVDWEVIKEDFPNRKWNLIRDRWMRYVRPVLFDTESAESTEPNDILNFEIDLMEAIIKSGVKTKKEIIWPLIHKEFPKRALATLQTSFRSLTRVDYSGTGDFQKQLRQILGKLEAGETQANDPRGFNKNKKVSCAIKRTARNNDLINHYKTLLARKT